MEKKEGIKMEFETLKESHKKEILIGAVVFILIAVVLIVRASFAKYQTTKNVTIAEGTVNYKVPDFKIMAMYKNDGAEDVEITTMPESGYTINESKSYCNLNGSKDSNAKLYTDENGNHVISKLTKGDRCYLYFDKQTTKKVNTPLGIIEVNLDTPNFSKTSCTSGCGESTVGIYEGNDDDGKTYYYRGDVENNYVKFANKFWRIIRINGDGSIRMIYDGTTARANGSTFTADTSAFNTSYNNNMYVGFKYTSGDVHGTGTKSTILTNLESWYSNNLASYASKLDTNAGFCGDRTPSTSSTATNNSGGTGTITTYYGGYIRLITNKAPNLTCPTEDLYTVSGAKKGNKSLTYPIGLITADEVSMAGGVDGTANKSYYLYTGQAYWTLSPSVHPNANVFYVNSDGYLSGWSVTYTNGVRPVINLKANTTMTGKGTASDPYVVS